MKNWKLWTAASFLLVNLNGCSIIFGPESGSWSFLCETDDYYVNSHFTIPYEVRELIADRVSGYSTPEINSYSSDIYPLESAYDPDNLPCYVKADFNGDGWYDYAIMFSKESRSNEYWYLKTKLLVVVSTDCGLELSSEYVLGTVKGSLDTPVEEYWGIRLLERGTHTLRTIESGKTEEVRVELANDGIYLGSIEPEERTVLYVTGTELNEYYVNLGAVPKRKIATAQERESRVIDLSI